MVKNPNNATIYIRDENLEDWQKRIGKSFKSDFVNWCLKNKLNEYLEHLNKVANPFKHKII